MIGTLVQVIQAGDKILVLSLRYEYIFTSGKGAGTMHFTRKFLGRMK